MCEIAAIYIVLFCFVLCIDLYGFALCIDVDGLRNQPLVMVMLSVLEVGDLFKRLFVD
jgi:hypothetical protein